MHMEEKLKRIECDPICGFAVQSHDENEVVDLAKQHADTMHPDLKTTRDEIRDMMKEVP